MEPPSLGSDSSKHKSDSAETAVSAKMAEREAKKQRLRKLQDKYDYVRKIVSHMEKHYSTTEPPPWLDLRAVAGQIARSSAKSASHRAWISLRTSVTAVEGWMHNRNSWRDAVQVSKMPHIGTASEIKAVEFIKGDAHFPSCLMRALRRIKLDFLLDTLPPSEDEVPGFWKGAELNSPEWRNVYMRLGYHRQPSFADDLTDLVLSTVCQKDKFGSGDAQSLLTCAGAEENDEESALSNDRPETEKHSVEPLEEERTSRNANKVDKRCVAEHANILGKRCRQEDNETDTPEVHEKRQKTGEQALQTQKILDKVEDSEDNRSSISSSTVKATVAKEAKRFRALKIGYKQLKKQDQQLAALCANLEERNKKLEVDAEQLAEEHQKLRKDHDAEKQKYQHVAEKCDELDRQNEKREDKAQQLAVQCAALTDDVRKLEDKSGQLAAQCNAFEDENKILRGQLVSLMSRVVALEQAQSALSHQVEPAPTPAPAPVDRTKKLETRERGHTRQRSVQGVLHTDKVSPGLQRNIRGAADPTAPFLQWQSAGTDKYENMDNLAMDQPTPFRHKRAGPRFSRVLEMPTFEPAWDPQHQVSSHRTPADTRPVRPTAYPDTLQPLAFTTSHRHTSSAVRASPPTQSLARPPAPVQMPAPASARMSSAAPTRAFTNTDASASASANEDWRETGTESHTTTLNTHPDGESNYSPLARRPQRQQRHDRQQHQSPSNTHAHTMIVDPRLWPSPAVTAAAGATAAAKASTPEIPAGGQAQGLPHDRLGELMERFRQALGDFLGDQGGDAQGREEGPGVNGQGQGQVDDLPPAGTGGKSGENGEEGGYCLAAAASEAVAGGGEGDGE